MVRAKQVETPEPERLVSKYYSEDDSLGGTCNMNWKQVPIPSQIQIDPLLARLRQHKQVSDDEETAQEDTLKIDLAEHDKIQTVRKESVFSERVTESEQAIIQQRVALQQRQYQEFERKEKSLKMRKVRDVYYHLTNEEIAIMLDEHENDEQEVILRLTQPTYLCQIRKRIALKHTHPDAKDTMSEEQQVNYTQLLEKRSKTLKKTTDEAAKKTYRTRPSRLGLDEALKKMQDNSVDPFEGWSSARIRAYQMIEKNPNSYYYRFNAPGEEQRKGPWTAEEQALFHKRIEEVGSKGQWGIFAMKIPGRVGYQCSNYYRLLVETNQIQDPNYIVDEKGKARYLFEKKKEDGSTEKTIRTYIRHGAEEGVSSSSSSTTDVSSGPETPDASTTTPSVHRKRHTQEPTTATSKHKNKRRRRAFTWNSSDEEQDDDFEDHDDTSGTFKVRSTTSTSSSSKRTRTRNTQAPHASANQDENPLPGFIDPITLDEVIKPAISTYGHVMGWVRCLTNWEGKKNICPLTKKRLTKRDLIVLTPDNIEAYRDKIIQ
ncbi:Homeodomain-like DNA binding domain-containing transcription factor [Mucor lusitanicus CBS 277.49]|uniref:Homeodomain-like DNA binding domain-containing transcription factor n=1 Tax=Mucor lusitanicus CBS 277.49 TaxID=747725 RepID=A0A168PIX4_MUCCL|nr:Homeodomain-like DNA binding domain-containing transcription factor [Mucor lusitanicus CBS 277.49]